MTIEPTDEQLEAAAARGADDARTALAAASAASAVLEPNAEGAWALWGFSPVIPFFNGSRRYDAYMDGWYEVAFAALTA